MARKACLLLLLAIARAEDVCEAEVCVALLQQGLKRDNVATALMPASSAWPAPVPLTAYLPMREQWFANFGYCGETSFIQSGLLYGQYMSQWDFRDRLSHHQSSSSDQLLLGVNDAAAANLLGLAYETFANNDVGQFMAWAQGHTKQGHPVVTAVLENFGKNLPFFYTLSPEMAPGQSEYDHIVTLVDVSGSSMDDYTFTIYDHGLWGTAGSFTFKAKDVTNSREGANAAATPYSIVDSSQKKYGIALTGPATVIPNQFPVYVVTDPNQERPKMKEKQEAKPTARPMTLTATAYGLQPSANYVAYMYNSLAPSTAVQTWPFTAQGTTYTLPSVTIMADQVALFRCYSA